MSLTELMVVVGIIITLATASIPLFYYLQKSSRTKEARELVAQMQAHLAANHANKLLGDKPEAKARQLDSNPAPDECARCFEDVLEKGLTSKAWFKLSDTEYLFSIHGAEKSPADYQKSGNLKLIFDPVAEKLILGPMKPPSSSP